ncbi:hypothetical protein CEXT_442791 [Caerostris extrusa]|uniref:Uncharacterized protein n=1 Tax=Caerostris extrusa TaxID=172846 RepID=A0AAV4PGH6_CAEEX|nr:hypothetical protein CEXT_442791 [Caerostris extrusa]
MSDEGHLLPGGGKPSGLWRCRVTVGRGFQSNEDERFNFLNVHQRIHEKKKINEKIVYVPVYSHEMGISYPGEMRLSKKKKERTRQRDLKRRKKSPKLAKPLKFKCRVLFPPAI